ncbi:ImmA/IrrE family metallo-endopeptidase [Carboxydothermus hydrogenoformans]|uniref:HTH cro/C1-type domain-containing protein n=1 Tax=Carboxydothermus hydrogenoformans (strain ATCC BAA-161 / DSM 6008 / Z-2901) TaxID=246194 RepID=Q3AFB9_CARHZ|nr:ImmA/IrrE family metallo-endopeptidase [Carboxydothermus hydrogenoformans]ABB15522.1 conserved hypothetical protein [Carboxydothermus hydrogenoformans Z-2901]
MDSSKKERSNIVRVNISVPVLNWALERSGRFHDISRKFPKINEWLTGKSMPTLRQLEDLAKATSTPLGYFFLSKPPEEKLPIPFFRTLGDHTIQRLSPEFIETFYTMKRRQAWMRDYLIDLGHEPLPFVKTAKLEDNPHDVAQKIRNTLGLKNDWAANQPTWTAALRELQKKIEDIGIIVVVNSIVGNNTHRKLNPAEFRGFVLVDEYAPLIFVNGADSKAAQMFTLAHELAHIWYGSSAAFDLQSLHPANDKIEQACNYVAAEFLVPAAELRQAWSSIAHGRDVFQMLASRFKVSEIVIARRALDLKLINREQFLNFYENYLEKERLFGVKDNEGGNFYKTQNLRLGRRFAEAVIRAAKEGKILYREAYQLTGLYGKTFEEYAKFIDWGGML